MKAMQLTAGVMVLDTNVVIRHLDANGNAKPIFQESKLCIKLLDYGILSPRWINNPLGLAISKLGILGKWQGHKDAHNLITTTGKAAVAGLINGVGSVPTFVSIGQGIGTTAANAADTALETERTAAGGASAVHAVAAATATLVTTTTTNDTAQFVGTVSEAATLAITESGVFNNTTAGTMLCRQVFSAVNVVSGDSLQFTWKIKAA